MAILSMEQARAQLTQLPERLASDPDQQVITVTRRGKPVLAVLPWEVFEAIAETMEILGDEEQMASFRRGVADLAEGRTHSWEGIKAEQGL